MLPLVAMDSPPDTTDETLQVRINGIATGGAAVGRVIGPEGSARVGMAAFVAYAAPGEVVDVSPTRVWTRHLEADLADIVERSPDRIDARCPHFTVCGGCHLQHLGGDSQRDARRTMLVDALRTGGLADLCDLVAPTVAGPDFGYRQRATLHVDPLDGRAGYYVRRSHDLLVPTSCPVLRPALEAAIAEPIVLGPLSPSETADIALEEGLGGVYAVLRLSHPLSSTRLKAVVGLLEARFAGGSVQCRGRVPFHFGDQTVRRVVDGVETVSPPGVFAQANPFVNDLLIAHVKTVAAGARTACDLYAGSGNFTFPLAAAGSAILAVESDPELAASGRAEAARRGVPVRFVEDRVEKYVRRSPAPVDFLLADPPRSGLDKAAANLGFAKTMVLISCHLPAAVRDLKALVADGWSVRELRPFDMFPQTGHVEVATTLVRGDR
jgi:23S rRNA (uracil1939-C5)-methyltransferase